MVLTDEEIEGIRSEINNKKAELIAAATAHRVDEQDVEEINRWFRNGEVPQRPATLKQLMTVFAENTLTQASVRSQLKQYNDGRLAYGIEIWGALSRLFNDPRFLIEENWLPENLEIIAREHLAGFDPVRVRNYRPNTYIRRADLKLHILLILATGAHRMAEKTHHGIEGFYAEVDQACQNPDSLRKYPAELSAGMKCVGGALISAFLKEAGFTHFFKIDVHIRNWFNTPIFLRFQPMTDRKIFELFHEISERLDILPFHLDKIIYYYGYLFMRRPRACRTA